MAKMERETERKRNRGIEKIDKISTSVHRDAMYIP